MTKIVAISDQHGYLPEIPECDILLIAGDICPIDSHLPDYQIEWLDTDFRWWLVENSHKAKYIMGIAGNHDFVFETHKRTIPKNLPWIYLEDSGYCANGINIWGTPWQPWFMNWAFNAPKDDDKEEFLCNKFSLIPNNTDIIMCHGPPRGYGDKTTRDEFVGSVALLDAIDRVQPELCVFGHVHEGYGNWNYEWNEGGPILANVSLVNSDYRMKNFPTIFEIDF